MYTKGGWEVKVNHLPSANYSRTLVFCNGKEIANCNHSQLSKEDQESHAHLIAAAPALLEACKELLSHFVKAGEFWCLNKDNHKSPADTLDKIEKIVSQAEKE